MQKQLNAWYEGKKGQVITSKECKEFLLDIDYLLEEGGDFLIDTENVDEEIADISGPPISCSYH